MNKDNYFSLLICARPNNVELYVTGIPIGKIQDGAFIPHSFLLPNGEKKEVTINDLDIPYGEIGQLKEALVNFVNSIEIKDNKANVTK